MNNIITIDFETRSIVDLTECGRRNYMDSPSFKIILMAIKYDNNTTSVITMPTKEDLEQVMSNAEMFDYNLLAHNASFEISAMKHYGINTKTDGKFSIWRDSMISCRYYGIPDSLEKAGAYLNLITQKLSVGKELIKLFTQPIPDKVKERNNLPKDKIFYEPEDFPDKWAQFVEYCKYDVDTTYELYTSLPLLPDKIWSEWLLNLQINDYGILIDKDFCNIAIADLAEEEETSINKLKQMTGLENPKSRYQMKIWLKDFANLDIDSLTNNVILKLLELPDLSNFVKQVLSLFSIISRTSTAKYLKFTQIMTNENKIYDILNFYGAHTGRWSSWGVQIHNMKRISLDNYKELRAEAKEGMLPMLYTDLSDIYSQLIRTAIIVPKDKMLVIADFSQIEARVLQWFAGNTEALDIFRSGKDYYTYTASMMFNKPYEEIPKASFERRQGKIATLALGYGGAVGALERFPGGQDLTPEEKIHTVKLWRKANKKVVKFWSDLNAAFTKCYATQNTVILPVANDNYSLIFKYAEIGPTKKKSVGITLPSGRDIWFIDVKVSGENYVFFGKSSDDQFVPTYTKIYGGFLAENITQAMARDCLDRKSVV